MLKLIFFEGVPRGSANITNIANTRQYSPILINLIGNIDIENHAERL